MQDYIVEIVVFGVISWTILFLLTRRIFKKCSLDFSIRLVSTVHAILAVTLASLSVQDWSRPVFPMGLKSSPQQMQTLSVTVAYLLFDLVCCQFEENVKIDTTLHHLVCLVGIWAGLATERYGSEMVATLWLTEISTPFLHLRELLKEIGYKNTQLNLAVDILFAIVFTFARMIVGPYLVYMGFAANIELHMMALGLGLQLVSAFWFYKVARMVIYKLSSQPLSGRIHSSYP